MTEPERVTRISRLPDRTVTRGYPRWSVWDGKLAIVDVCESRFDVVHCARVYAVRFAIDAYTREPIEINESRIERITSYNVRVQDGSKQFHETLFTLGSRMHPASTGGYIEGTFAKEVLYFALPVALSDLSPYEHMRVRELLRDARYRFVETKRSAKGFEQLLARSFSEHQAGPYDTANEVDRLLRATGFDTCASDDACNAAWAKYGAQGFYTETRKGQIKWIQHPKGQ